MSNATTDDYANATFEPTIGSEDPDNPQVRIVATNTADAAARRFGYLVGVDGIDEQTQTYTWSDPDVGTLTYNKVTDGTAWATVDVSIPQVPHPRASSTASPARATPTAVWATATPAVPTTASAT